MEDQKHLDQAQDLIDFHLHWEEYRDDAVQVCELQHLSDNQRSTIQWLIKMADRIGSADLTAQVDV